jgi:hypothetical protein
MLNMKIIFIKKILLFIVCWLPTWNHVMENLEIFIIIKFWLLKNLEKNLILATLNIF